jgi:hypothetical protein
LCSKIFKCLHSFSGSAISKDGPAKGFVAHWKALNPLPCINLHGIITPYFSYVYFLAPKTGVDILSRAAIDLPVPDGYMEAKKTFYLLPLGHNLKPPFIKIKHAKRP